MGKGNVLAATRSKVGVAVLNLLDGLSRVLLRLVRGVGVGDVGLGSFTCQPTDGSPGALFTYLVTADDVAWVLDRRHIAEVYVEDVFGCGGLWKRMLRGERACLLSLYTAA